MAGPATGYVLLDSATGYVMTFPLRHRRLSPCPCSRAPTPEVCPKSGERRVTIAAKELAAHFFNGAPEKRGCRRPMASTRAPFSGPVVLSNPHCQAIQTT